MCHFWEATSESTVPRQGVVRRAAGRMAVDLGLQLARLLERLADLTRRLPDMAEQVVEDFAAAHGQHPLHLQMLRMITKRCGWVSRSVLADGIELTPEAHNSG